MKLFVKLNVILFISVLQFSYFNGTQAQGIPTGLPLENEPIDFIGHGTFFDRSGGEVSTSLDNMLSIQAYYRSQLSALLTTAERQTYNVYRSQLNSQWQEIQNGNDPIDQDRQQLIVNTILFDKQLELFNPADVGRLKGINNLIQQVALEPFIGLDEVKWASLVESSPFLQLYGQYREPKVGGTGILFLSTMAGGVAYINECIDNGVPRPPAWGDAAWQPTGALINENEFISRSSKARPYVYQSSSPVGACIALPRAIGNSDVATLLGIICVGKESGNSCFWDNQTTTCDSDPMTPCPESYNIDITPSPLLEISSSFLGGADLLGGQGGQCTACHAGENPFVIHPGTALGHPGLDVGGVTTQTMPDRFHDPIVHPLWYQNERSSTLTDLPEASRCASCHAVQPTGVLGSANGGRLPQLSQALRNDYCSAVIKNAINIATGVQQGLDDTGDPINTGNPVNTMPLGGVLTETEHTALVNTIDDFCDNGTDPGKDTGDPHIKTSNGVNYDFHAAGEFTLLKGTDDFEVQTRQAAIPTTFFPRENNHTGVASCVSINTGVATKIGDQRITYQSDIDGNPNPTAMELRVDGILTNLTSTPISLAAGGRLIKSSASGLEIEFPNGEYLSAVPGYWSGQDQWVLNISISGAEANRGIMGAIPRGSWLPRLSNGSTVGARPANSGQRYNTLNNLFADSWRVTDATSLFDYAAGLSPSSYELPGWPKSTPECVVPDRTATPPATQDAARLACSSIEDRDDRTNCEFDFELTGADIFVDIYKREQTLRRWGTKTEVSVVSGKARPIKNRVYVISVVPRWPGLTRQPTGSVEVNVDGEVVGTDRPVDSSGLAFLEGTEIDGTGEGAVITASYIPDAESNYIPSESPAFEIVKGSDVGPAVPPDGQENDKPFYIWIICILLVLLLIFLFIMMLRKRA